MATSRKMKRLTGNGEITKWGPGVAVQGELMARRDGKYGGLLDLRTDAGEEITVPETGLLRHRLAKIQVGTYLEIECTGKTQTRSGNQCWDFVVDVEEEPF